MENTHTQITFCITNEPILYYLQKQFSDYNFEILFNGHEKTCKVVIFKINKIIDSDTDNTVLINGTKINVEDVIYYKG